MTKRRAFIALAIFILLGSCIGVVYFQQNYEITRKTPDTTESEVEKTPETNQILTDAELADYRYRQFVKFFTENHKGDPEELEWFLNSPMHKQIVAKVKSPDEITAELSALSYEERKINLKEFEEKMKRVREKIKKDKLTPALSPLENMERYLQRLAELQALNESNERRVELYLKRKRENSNIFDDEPEIFDDEPVLPTQTERNPAIPINTFNDPNKPPDNNPWNDIVTEWDDILMKDYRDLFSETDKEAREAFSQQLPSDDARTYYVNRQVELHNQYAKRISAQLTSIPPEKREEAVARIRQELGRTWDADFIDAVMRQLQQKK